VALVVLVVVHSTQLEQELVMLDHTLLLKETAEVLVEATKTTLTEIQLTLQVAAVVQEQLEQTQPVVMVETAEQVLTLHLLGRLQLAQGRLVTMLAEEAEAVGLVVQLALVEQVAVEMVDLTLMAQTPL
jgi:hypothetical protein